MCSQKYWPLLFCFSVLKNMFNYVPLGTCLNKPLKDKFHSKWSECILSENAVVTNGIIKKKVYIVTIPEQMKETGLELP